MPVGGLVGGEGAVGLVVGDAGVGDGLVGAGVDGAGLVGAGVVGLVGYAGGSQYPGIRAIGSSLHNSSEEA